MADKQKNNLNEDQILAFLREAVDKIRTEEDPLELNLYRRLFRKAVPLTLRAYFTAYLLKEINTGKMPSRLGGSQRPERGGKSQRQGRSDGRTDGRQPREGGRAQNERQDEGRRGKQGEGRQGESRAAERREPRPAEGKVEPRNILPDDISTTLFVSIGRNRRVYPRDLIGLIMQNVEMERDHIGDIRVLDNYSFVQVITEDAEKIIAALNEFEYRGRKLAVSFSRKREDSSSASGASSLSAESPVHDDASAGDSAPESDSIPDSYAPSADEPLEGNADAGSWQSESDLQDGEEKDGNI
ncbi:MAG TPA: DbpA RNA binding domain-containing protein [Treponemataceae bacterium]|nr:DbpA RNA binding domain-containing protein [Treponemataceae bacterium]HPS43296.1 DbpA RNA binding domain-containing protein [Treponemataceae bacterium]